MRTEAPDIPVPRHDTVITLARHLRYQLDPFWKKTKSYLGSPPPRRIAEFSLGMGLSWGKNVEKITNPPGQITNGEYGNSADNMTTVTIRMEEPGYVDRWLLLGALSGFGKTALATALVRRVSSMQEPEEGEGGVGFYDGVFYTAIRDKHGNIVGRNRDLTFVEDKIEQGGRVILVAGENADILGISDEALEVRRKLPEIYQAYPHLVKRYLQSHGTYPDIDNPLLLVEEYATRTGDLATRNQQLADLYYVMAHLIDNGELPAPQNFAVHYEEDFARNPSETLEYATKVYLPFWKKRTVGSDHEERALILVNRRIPSNTGIREYRHLLRTHSLPRQFLKAVVDDVAGMEANETIRQRGRVQLVLDAISRLEEHGVLPFDYGPATESISWPGYSDWANRLKTQSVNDKR